MAKSDFRPVPRVPDSTVKRVKSAWLGNTAAMMHYMWIVNSRGSALRLRSQSSDPPYGVQAYSMLPLKMLRECCPLRTGLEQLASSALGDDNFG